jgi:hypothetical protein
MSKAYKERKRKQLNDARSVGSETQPSTTCAVLYAQHSSYSQSFKRHSSVAPHCIADYFMYTARLRQFTESSVEVAEGWLEPHTIVFEDNEQSHQFSTR